jgi:hypothetical protein
MADLEWTYDPERQLFAVRYLGRVTLDVFLRARIARRSIGVDYGGVRVLIDTRDADVSELTGEDFKTMEAERETRFGGIAERAAAVVGSEIDQDIAKLWAFYRNRSVPDSAAVFLSEREALAWLLAERRG